MKKFDEKQILNLIVSKLESNNLEPLLGRDDIALIPFKKINEKLFKDYIAITCDMLVEHTDVPPKMTFKQIARKSLVSCVSDLTSKGIKPMIALISLGIPEYLSKIEISELIKGFTLTSKEFGFFIIGGDINQAKELIIDCHMIGFSSQNLNIPRRNGAIIDDLVIVSGKFGNSSAGLKILLESKISDKEFKNEAINSVLNPDPSFKFGLKLSKYLSSSIDSSDGLAISLYELAKESKVDLLIYKEKIPTSSGLEKFSQINNIDMEDLIFHGGEEYHIIGTITKKNLTKINRLAKKYKLDFYIIGKVIAGKGRVFIEYSNQKRKILKNKGFIHLS